MVTLICIIFLLISASPLKAEILNLTLPHQHPNPEFVVQEVQRRILTSTTNVKLNEQQSCLTGNPIDDCWQCDPNWANDRQRLADCAIGFGQGATGGKGGQIYVVSDSSDDNVADPKPGTLRHALIQIEPLWIIFSANMKVELSHELIVGSFKTIDGRGADVYITGRGCITIQDVSNVIIHNIHVYDCVPSKSADIRLSPTQVEHKGKSDGDGISIMRSRNIWVDHCAISHCTDGLIDVTMGSTAVTLSNNYFSHHDKVMLLGHTDNYMLDKGMQVTIAFNHFGVQLVQRMPRCRHGYFHVVNNDYTEWKMYAIGGSAEPTIISQGNRYTAPDNPSSKQACGSGLTVAERYWSNRLGIHICVGGQCWKVCVRKDNGVFRFDDGWDQVLSAVGLCSGDFVVLQRDKNPFHLQMLIFRKYIQIGCCMRGYAPQQFVRVVNKDLLRTAEMIIPRIFWDKYIRDMGSVVQLQTFCGTKYSCVYLKTLQKLVGLQEFLACNKISQAKLVIFEYIGHSCFTVSIISRKWTAIVN